MGSVDAVGEVEAVYRRVHRRLWRALVALSCDVDIASEGEAEAFAQALRRGDAIDDVEAWVWRTAFRITSGLLAERRATAQRQVPLDGSDMAETAPGSTAEFLGLLGDLSVQQQACVALRYIAGFDAARIADVLGTSPGTVRVQLHRAHQSLRASLRASSTPIEGGPNT